MTKFLTTSLCAMTFALGTSACATAHEGAHTQDKAAEKQAPEKMQAPDITLDRIDDGFYLLGGPGGNIGVSTGEDGVYVIDDKFSRFAPQILARIREISDQPIRFVINTHFHGDHTGANAEMKETGALILAHDNVRERMVNDFETQKEGGDAPGEALWPTLTFSDTATLHFNGQTATAYHTPHAHTDGDSMIVFMPANIIHMGDDYFNGLFPFVDVDSGGTLQGMIAAQEKILSMADDDTKIIPGHGPMATKADLQKTHDILADILSQVQAAKDSGLSLDETLETVTLDEYKDLSSFIDQKGMVRATYRSLEG